MAEGGEKLKLVWPEHRLDWTIKFPVLVNDGRGGDEIFEMGTEQMLKRSTYFVRQLSSYNPTKGVTSHVIESPACEVPTFEYYKRCVETGEVTREGGAFGLEVSDAGYTGGGSNGGLAADDAQVIHDKVTAYCKGHFLADKLGDCKTANSIIDALIDYLVDTEAAFAEDQLALIIDSAGHHSRLWKLAMHVWFFKASDEMRRRDEQSFAIVYWQDFVFEEEANGHPAVQRTRNQLFDRSLSAQDRAWYHCYNELHPRPIEEAWLSVWSQRGPLGEMPQDSYAWGYHLLGIPYVPRG